MLQNGDKYKAAYDQRLEQFRPALPGELFDPAARGRENIDKKLVKPTTAPGIAPPSQSRTLYPIQERNRGVDMYRRTVPQYKQQEPIPSTVSRP